MFYVFSLCVPKRNLIQPDLAVLNTRESMKIAYAIIQTFPFVLRHDTWKAE
jgi:hypothetical protein